MIIYKEQWYSIEVITVVSGIKQKVIYRIGIKSTQSITRNNLKTIRELGFKTEIKLFLDIFPCFFILVLIYTEQTIYYSGIRMNVVCHYFQICHSSWLAVLI